MPRVIRFQQAIGTAFLVLAFALLRHSAASAGEALVLSDADSPSLSPDGSELVCSTAAGIVRVTVSGDVSDTLAQNTPSQDVSSPVWHPDGDKVVYLSREPGPGWNIVLHDLTSGPVATWYAATLWDDYGISLFPQNNEVLFNDMDNQTWAMDLADGSIRTVMTGTDATVAPDGQWIAFVTNLDDNAVAVEPVGGGPRTLFESGGYVTWTTDSNSIIYTNESLDLVLASRDGSSSEVIVADPDWDLAASQAAGKVAFTRCTGEFGRCSVWVTDLQPSTAVHSGSWGRLKGIYR